MQQRKLVPPHAPKKASRRSIPNDTEEEDVVVFNPRRCLDFGDIASIEEIVIPHPQSDINWDNLVVSPDSLSCTRRDSSTVRRAVSAISRSGLEITGECQVNDLRIVMQTHGSLSDRECDKAISMLKGLNKWIIFANSTVTFPGEVSAAEIVRELS